MFAGGTTDGRALRVELAMPTMPAVLLRLPMFGFSEAHRADVRTTLHSDRQGFVSPGTANLCLRRTLKTVLPQQRVARRARSGSAISALWSLMADGGTVSKGMLVAGNSEI